MPQQQHYEYSLLLSETDPSSLQNVHSFLDDLPVCYTISPEHHFSSLIDEAAGHGGGSGNVHRRRRLSVSRGECQRRLSFSHDRT